MADDMTDLLEEAEETIDMLSDPFEISDFPQTLVTEKIIFVVDIILLGNDQPDLCGISQILNLLKSYFNLKKRICVKPAQFECLIYSSDAVQHFNINSDKNLNEAVKSIQHMVCDEDKEPLKIDKVFDKIATLVEFPDPDCSKQCLPPNWVYHVIWLFGRNLHIPTMQSTNSFDFLMITPYFALDMVYLRNQTLENNQCQQISQALCSLNENGNGKGYFLKGNLQCKKDLYSCIAQCLGHPLIRIPQGKARYDAVELLRQIEVVKNNNDEK